MKKYLIFGVVFGIILMSYLFVVFMNSKKEETGKYNVTMMYGGKCIDGMMIYNSKSQSAIDLPYVKTGTANICPVVNYMYNTKEK